MLVEHPVALARADKNLKKDIPWISVSAVGMFLGSPTDIQRIGPMSEIDIFWTSTGLTCVMWVTIGAPSQVPRTLSSIKLVSSGGDSSSCWNLISYSFSTCLHFKLKFFEI